MCNIDGRQLVGSSPWLLGHLNTSSSQNSIVRDLPTRTPTSVPLHSSSTQAFFCHSSVYISSPENMNRLIDQSSSRRTTLPIQSYCSTSVCRSWSAAAAKPRYTTMFLAVHSPYPSCVPSYQVFGQTWNTTVPEQPVYDKIAIAHSVTNLSPNSYRPEAQKNMDHYHSDQ